jgi:hypothetical protein
MGNAPQEFEIPQPPDIDSGADAIIYSGIEIVATAPENIKLHSIQDFELDALTNISRPIVLCFSTMLLGGALGLLPSVLDGFGKLPQGKYQFNDIVILAAATACLAAGSVFAFFAARSLADAERIKREIRSRPYRPYR